MAFLGIFTAEMMLRVVARGPIGHKHSYLYDPWNRLDFLVVLTDWVALAVQTFHSGDGEDVDALSAIRAARLLRPLRAINRVSGMKVLVNSLLNAIPQMTSVALL